MWGPWARAHGHRDKIPCKGAKLLSPNIFCRYDSSSVFFAILRKTSRRKTQVADIRRKSKADSCNPLVEYDRSEMGVLGSLQGPKYKKQIIRNPGWGKSI